MAKGVVRLGDLCSGHGCWPPRPNDTASPNVFTNSKAQHRQTDHWVVHCCLDCHDGNSVRGSSSVYVNGLQIFREGDPVDCGSVGMEHSPNVFAGG